MNLNGQALRSINELEQQWERLMCICACKVFTVPCDKIRQFFAVVIRRFKPLDAAHFQTLARRHFRDGFPIHCAQPLPAPWGQPAASESWVHAHRIKWTGFFHFLTSLTQLCVSFLQAELVFSRP